MAKPSLIPGTSQGVPTPIPAGVTQNTLIIRGIQKGPSTREGDTHVYHHVPKQSFPSPRERGHWEGLEAQGVVGPGRPVGCAWGAEWLTVHSFPAFWSSVHSLALLLSSLMRLICCAVSRRGSTLDFLGDLRGEVPLDGSSVRRGSEVRGRAELWVWPTIQDGTMSKSLAEHCGWEH